MIEIIDLFDEMQKRNLDPTNYWPKKYQFVKDVMDIFDKRKAASRNSFEACLHKEQKDRPLWYTHK